MRAPGFSSRILAALLLSGLPAFIPAAEVHAQEWSPPRGFVGLDVLMAEPVGEFSQNVGRGWGLEVRGRYALDPEGWMSLRGDAGFVQYGHERQRVCSAYGCRVLFDLTTRNQIFFAGVGPELAIPGEWIRPYVHAGLGLGYFSTSSGLSGTADTEEFAHTENFSDAVMAWSTGAGVEVLVRRGPTPVALNFAWSYHGNGEAEYLREGDIVDNPDGSITLFPRRSEANLMTFRIGFSVGLRKDRDDCRRCWRGDGGW